MRGVFGGVHVFHGASFAISKIAELRNSITPHAEKTDLPSGPYALFLGCCANVTEVAAHCNDGGRSSTS